MVESILMQDSRIRAAVVFGSGHTQNGVIIEPAERVEFVAEDELEKTQFIELIWCAHS